MIEPRPAIVARHASSCLFVALLCLTSAAASATVLLPYEPGVYRDLADCVVEATPVAREPVDAIRGVAIDELIYVDPDVSTCSHPAPRVFLPAEDERVQLGAGWDWSTAERYRFFLVDASSDLGHGAYGILGLSEGVRPLVVSGAPPAVAPYELVRTGGTPARWSEELRPVVFRFDEDGTEDVGDGSDRVELARALQTWSAPACTNIEVQSGGIIVADDPLSDDRVNVVAFEEERFPEVFGGPVIVGLTALRYTADGRIREADILLNGADFRWSTDGLGVAFDVRGVAIHEVGHALGLAHSDVLDAAMYPVTSASRSVLHRRLSRDDVEGICTLYPCPGGQDCSRPAPPLGDVGDSSGGLGLCAECEADADCGGPQDRCLFNDRTLEAVCGRACGDRYPCPTGFVCAEVQDATRGSVSQCIPEENRCPDRLAFLCRTCVEDRECATEADLCVPRALLPSGGEGSFCAASCSGGVACPEGYRCFDLRDGNGRLLSQQCVSEAFECVETPKPPPSEGRCAAVPGRPAPPWRVILLVVVVLGSCRRTRRC